MTAGIAATRPKAVARSAWAMPGATTARLVVCAFDTPMKLFMMSRPNGGEHAGSARNFPAHRHLDAFELQRDAFLQAVRAQVCRQPDFPDRPRASAAIPDCRR